MPPGNVARQHRALKHSRLPTFAIIGAQKAATTFLQTALRQNEAVHMPRGETPFFEDPAYGDGNLDLLREQIGANEASIVGIKRPTYLSRPEVPARLAADLPDPKLIAVLRNPIERAIAAYFHLVSLDLVPERDINEGIRDLLAGRADSSFDETVLTYGLYGEHLARFLDHFDRRNMYLVEYDRFFGDPGPDYLAACRHIGLTGPVEMPDFQRRINKTAYGKTQYRVRRALATLRYRKDGSGERAAERDGITGKLLGIGVSVLRRAGDTLTGVMSSQAARPILTPDNERRLLEYFEDDVARCEQISGLNLSHWRIPPSHRLGADQSERSS